MVECSNKMDTAPCLYVYPTVKQDQAMRNFSGCCRFAYNTLPFAEKEQNQDDLDKLESKQSFSKALSKEEVQALCVKLARNQYAFYLNAAWCKFFTYLEYKLRLKGGILIKTKLKHISKICSQCGLKVKIIAKIRYF